MLDLVCYACKKLPAPSIIDTRTYPNITSEREFFFGIGLFSFVIGLFRMFSWGEGSARPCLRRYLSLRKHSLSPAILFREVGVLFRDWLNTVRERSRGDSAAKPEALGASA